MQEKELIFIAIPILQAKQSEEIATLREMCQKLNHDPLHPFRYISDTVNDKTGVEYARNLLCGKMLKTKASRLWFFDYDVTPPPNCFDLLHVDADIVGGLYPMRRQNPDNAIGIMFPCLLRNEDGTYRMFKPEADHREPVIPVDATGMGMTIIRRELLEDPLMRLGPDAHLDAPAIFRTPREINGKLISTEDIDFCERAKAHGYSIYAKLDVVGDHRKVMNLGLVWRSMESAFEMGRQSVGTTSDIPVGAA